MWVDKNCDLYDNTNTSIANTNTSFDSTILNNLSLNSVNYSISNGLFNIMRMSNSLVNGVFGSTSTFGSSGGTGIASFSETIYVPNLFNPTFSGFTSSNTGVTVSKSAGFTISINVDNSNTFDNLIFIRDLNSPTNVLEMYIPYNASSKTFSSGDLSQFGLRSKLDFAIARGNVKYFNHNGIDVQIRAGVIQHCTTFELVP